MIGASWNDKNVPREEDHRRDLTFIGQKKACHQDMLLIIYLELD